MLVTVLQLFSTVRSPWGRRWEEARGERPGADGINLAQPKAAAQYAEAWSLFRTSLETCSPVPAGCPFIHPDRRGNGAAEPVLQFTQGISSWHQSWCCEHAVKLQGPIQSLLTSMETFPWTSPDCGSGSWFVIVGIPGSSPCFFWPEMVKVCARHPFNSSGCPSTFLPLMRGVCDQSNRTQTLLHLQHLLHCDLFSAHSARRMPLTTAAGTAELWGVRPRPLLSPSSARVCFSTWCWLNCKIYNQENLKGPFSLLGPVCSSGKIKAGHPAENPACDRAALYWCEEV